MAAKSKKARKPDSVIPPWQQATAEDGNDSAPGALPGDGSADAARVRAGRPDRNPPSVKRGKGATGDAGTASRRADGGTARRAELKKQDKTKTGSVGAMLAWINDTLSGIRKRSTVILIDGTKLTEIAFRSSNAMTVTENDHDTAAEALQAALVKRGGRRMLVWCGRVTARVSRPVEASEHADVKRLADAQYLAKVFGKDHFVAMSGAVAMTPDVPSESAEELAERAPRMTVSGMCVNLDEDGIWLRVGRSLAEATLVHQGQISGWTTLCDGLNSVAERIRQGQAPMRARADLAERVASETRRAIMQWQRTRTVPPQIWLHGPGGDPSGEVHQALVLHSGCRVAPPRTEEGESAGPALSQYTSVLPAATWALSAPQLHQPVSVLDEAGKLKRQQKLRITAAVLAVFGGMAAFAEYQGFQVKERSEAAQARITAAENAAKSEERQIVDKAKRVKPLVDHMQAYEAPDWSKLFEMHERYPNETGLMSIQASNHQTDINVADCCDGINMYPELLAEFEQWARAIYGPEATATSTSGIQEEADGTIRANSSLNRPKQEE